MVGTDDLLADLSQALDKAHGRGGLSLTEGSRSDGGDLNVLAVGPVGQPLHYAHVIELCHIVAVGQQLPVLEAQLPGKLLHRFHVRFRGFCYFPVLHRLRIKPAHLLLLGCNLARFMRR